MTNTEIDVRLNMILEYRKQLKALENKITELENEVKEGMDAPHVETDNFRVHYTDVETTRFDSKEFKVANPAIYNMYCKVTLSKRFTFSNV